MAIVSRVHLLYGRVSDDGEGRQDFTAEGKLRWSLGKERYTAEKGVALVGIWEAINNSYLGLKVTLEREIIVPDVEMSHLGNLDFIL